MHLVAVPLTRPPGVHTKPTAALQTNGPQFYKRLKRKLDDDGRLRAPIEEILNDDDHNDDHNEDNDGGDTTTCSYVSYVSFFLALIALDTAHFLDAH